LLVDESSEEEFDEGRRIESASLPDGWYLDVRHFRGMLKYGSNTGSVPDSYTRTHSPVTDLMQLAKGG